MNTIGEPCDRKGHARFDGEALAWDRCYGGAVYAPGGNARKLLARLWLSSSIQCLTLHKDSNGIALSSISRNAGGLVKVNNERWRAKSEEDIGEGDIVVVAGLRGVTLMVRKSIEEEKG